MPAFHHVKILKMHDAKKTHILEQDTYPAELISLCQSVCVEIQRLERCHRQCDYGSTTRVQAWIGEEVGDPLGGKYEYLQEVLN
jgi:hypothetical protein